MITGAVHRPPDIYLTAENPGNPQLGDRRRRLRLVIASNGIPSLQMRSVGSNSTSRRKMEGKKEMMVGFRFKLKKFIFLHIFTP